MDEKTKIYSQADQSVKQKLDSRDGSKASLEDQNHIHLPFKNKQQNQQHSSVGAKTNNKIQTL